MCDNQGLSNNKLSGPLGKSTLSAYNNINRYATLCSSRTVIQTGGPSLMAQLDSKCKLSQRAQLLLAVSDQAAAGEDDKAASGGPRAVSAEMHKVRHNHHRHSHSQHHADKDSSQHWLLG
jgi:hypothetical protein